MHAQRKPSVHTNRPAAAASRLRREVRGNVIQWRTESAARHVPAGTLRLPASAYPLPRPGEDGEPQVMSERAFNLCLALVALGVVLVGSLQKAGLL